VVPIEDALALLQSKQHRQPREVHGHPARLVTGQRIDLAIGVPLVAVEVAKGLARRVLHLPAALIDAGAATNPLCASPTLTGFRRPGRLLK
jgi:hypothetical protein